jgi:WXG100 family type VII secretion target
MLDKAARSADDAAAEVRKNGLTLVSSMQAQASGFTGQAGNAFRIVLGDLMNDLNTILNQLEQMSANARVSANKLTDQDEASAGSVKKVSFTAGGVTSGLT